MIRFFQFVLIVMTLAVVALLSAVTTMHFAIHGAEVTVPDFKGLTTAEAERRAAALGLNLSVDNHFYSVEIPAGHIVHQAPVAGTVVRREWHVRLTDSLGPQRVAIPNITGQQQRAATITIRRVGLELGTTAQMPWNPAAPGTVIAQNPQPDASGVERPSVSLLVASPNEQTSGGMVMPDFVGQPFQIAAMAITHAGLKLAPVREVSVSIPSVPSTDSNQAPVLPIPVGAVVSQSPAAGYRVDANTTIDLTVAH